MAKAGGKKLPRPSAALVISVIALVMASIAGVKAVLGQSAGSQKSLTFVDVEGIPVPATQESVKKEVEQRNVRNVTIVQGGVENVVITRAKVFQVEAVGQENVTGFNVYLDLRTLDCAKVAVNVTVYLADGSTINASWTGRLCGSGIHEVFVGLDSAVNVEDVVAVRAVATPLPS